MRHSCAKLRRFRAFEPTLWECRADTVIAWPLRLRIHGMTSGLCSVPSLPTAAATGMPKSMCAAWALPLKSPSRLAVQLPNLATLEVMPYRWKNFFSCATTIGAQSVNGRIPNVRWSTSGSPGMESSGDRLRASSGERSRASARRAKTSVERSGDGPSALYPFPWGWASSAIFNPLSYEPRNP